MSADLLAAFGDTQPEQSQGSVSQNHADRRLDHSSLVSDQREQPWILQSRPLHVPQSLKAQKEEPLWKPDDTGANILFDASDFELQADEDDFGDFEEAPITTGKQASPPPTQGQCDNIDLLGLDAALPAPSSSNLKDFSTRPPGLTFHPSDQKLGNTSQNSQPWSLSFDDHNATAWEIGEQDDDWGNFETAQADEKSSVLSPKTKISSNKSSIIKRGKPPQQIQSNDNDEGEEEPWDTFEDGVPEPALDPQPASTSAPAPAPAHGPNSSQTQPVTPSQPSTSPPSTISSKPHPRPTNIPPPSMLLHLLPQIYQTLHQQCLSTPSLPPTQLASLAQQIQRIYTTTARLLAGRPHRWKRDTILSQSFRISTSSGLKSSGMKLTSLDKSATVKEDQDAAEAVASWQRHAAALNAVMLKAKVARAPMGLAVSMGVRAAGTAGTAGKGEVGVLTAREACAVCGLKRNERVTGIDVKVEDTFGEFWVEFWGHRGCYDFWYEYEGLLDKR